jgi:FAD synthetase
MDEQKTVLVFGTFDGLHDGHRFFLREAKRLGIRLVVSVATDEVVEKLKKRHSAHGLAERMAALLGSGLVDEAVAGDTELGSFTALRNYRPDIIALGYDQSNLAKKLGEYIKAEHLPIELRTVDSYKSGEMHSRMLRDVKTKSGTVGC